MAAQPPPPSVTQSEPDSAVAVRGCRVLWPSMGDETPTHVAVIPMSGATSSHTSPSSGDPSPPRTPTRASHPALSSVRFTEPSPTKSGKAQSSPHRAALVRCTWTSQAFGLGDGSSVGVTVSIVVFFFSPSSFLPSAADRPPVPDSHTMQSASVPVLSAVIC